MKPMILAVAVTLALTGCGGGASDNNCPVDTPLPCVGTSSCCPSDAPILCGGQCFNTMPSAAQCNGDPITVCTTASTCERGSYCYEWICFGDPECVATNPDGTALGANDEGNDVSCAGLVTFGEHFWGIPPAWQTCALVP